VVWENTLAGMALYNVESLESYMPRESGDMELSLKRYVCSAVERLPWYFSVPVKSLGWMIGLLCLVFMRGRLLTLNPDGRAAFLAKAQYLPFFELLNKLIRTLAFLKIFDSVSERQE
jgi:hypothetical protein